MPHLILELILWMLLAFFIGCIMGCILHRLVAGGEATVIAPDGERGSSPAAPELPAVGPPSRPTGIAAAREGKPDNLQRISGIGPMYERTLHNLGFFHF